MPLRAQAALAVFAAAMLLVACGGSDPRSDVLDERARWNVELLSWAAGEDGRLLLGTRVSGPVHARLRELTIRIELLDADEQALGREWWTLDVSGIKRGGPEDVSMRLAAPGFEVDGIRFDPVLAPTRDEEAQIRELQDLPTP